MNGIYWGLTALALMDHQDALDRQEMIDWVMSCWVEDIGGTLKLPPVWVSIRGGLSFFSRQALSPLIRDTTRISTPRSAQYRFY